MIEILLYIFVTMVCVFLALALLVFGILIAPIKYSLNASKNGKTEVVARVSWLLKIARYTYELRDGMEKSEFYVLFFRLDKPPRWWRRIKRRAHRMLQGNSKGNPKENPKGNSKTTHEAKKKTPVKKSAPPPKTDETLFDQLLEAYSGLTDGQGKIIMKHAVSLIGSLLKILKPRCFDVSGVIGTGCPFNTAMVLGLYESLAGMFDIRKNVRFAGDFNCDDFFIKYNADVRGKASILRITYPIVRFALHRSVREWLLKLWKDD
ncbi:MAG: hypothetical protein FWF80_06910 [Defluviitaleaceae bacterium]|nr:hypothetical protein [Defluviitaleaceae bacterium]